MEQIIQQITIETVKEILQYREIEGFRKIHEMSDALKAISDRMAGRLLVVFIEEADRAICEDAKAQRRADGLAIHERGVERTTFTSLGSISFKRTYFNAPAGRSYLLDSILGIEPYERVDAGVSARMLDEAAYASFGRSAGMVTGGQVSRQTAWNKMRDLGEVTYVPKRVADTPPVIHIFADEDHVDMQDATNATVPIVTICGGKRPVCKGRNALIDPVHVQGYRMKPEKHWEYVYAVCAEQYDMGKVEQVYLYGDGAKWVMGGLDFFPGAIHVLDEYHFEKRMKALFAGDVCGPFLLRGRTAVAKNDKGAFQKIVYEMEDAVCATMAEGKPKRKRLRAVKEDGAYILTYWEAIQANKFKDTIGSCTEALVSHLLSERISRDPMGWSEAGLAQMAMVRVYRKNGCAVNPRDIGKGKEVDKRKERKRALVGNIKIYEDIIQKQHDEVFAGRSDWRWFERDEINWISSKRTGTEHALSLLKKAGYVC